MTICINFRPKKCPWPRTAYYCREAWRSVGGWGFHPALPFHPFHHGGWHPIPWLRGHGYRLLVECTQLQPLRSHFLCHYNVLAAGHKETQRHLGLVGTDNGFRIPHSCYGHAPICDLPSYQLQKALDINQSPNVVDYGINIRVLVIGGKDGYRIYIHVYRFTYRWIYIYIYLHRSGHKPNSCNSIYINSTNFMTKAIKHHILVKSVTRDTVTKTKALFPHDQSTGNIFRFHSDVFVHHFISGLNGFGSGYIYHNNYIMAKHTMHTIISWPNPKQ